jgi:hypothetical protein
MTDVEQLMQQIDHLSNEEKAALRELLEKDLASVQSKLKSGNNGTSNLASDAQTGLWGLFAEHADAMDHILEFTYEARQNRPLRLP